MSARWDLLSLGVLETPATANVSMCLGYNVLAWVRQLDVCGPVTYHHT